MVGLEAVVLSPEELVDELLLGGVVLVQVVPFGDLLLCRCSPDGGRWSARSVRKLRPHSRAGYRGIRDSLIRQATE